MHALPFERLTIGLSIRSVFIENARAPAHAFPQLRPRASHSPLTSATVSPSIMMQYVLQGLSATQPSWYLNLALRGGAPTRQKTKAAAKGQIFLSDDLVLCAPLGFSPESSMTTI